MNADIVEFGILGMAMAILYRVLGLLPLFKNQNNGNISNSDVAIASLSESMKEISKCIQESASHLKSLDEAHSGIQAMRPEGGYRWWNLKAVEKATLESKEMIAEVLTLVKKTKS